MHVCLIGPEDGPPWQATGKTYIEASQGQYKYVLKNCRIIGHHQLSYFCLPKVETKVTRKKPTMLIILDRKIQNNKNKTKNTSYIYITLHISDIDSIQCFFGFYNFDGPLGLIRQPSNEVMNVCRPPLSWLMY